MLSGFLAQSRQWSIWNLCLRTFYFSDKAVILPAALRAPRRCFTKPMGRTRFPHHPSRLALRARRNGLPGKPGASFVRGGGHRLRLGEALLCASANYHPERNVGTTLSVGHATAGQLAGKNASASARHGGTQGRATAPRKTLTAGLMKYRHGARSAAGSMTALSPARNAREHRFQMLHCLLQARGPA